ncbi:MAG: GNAT family N-acetyltransferase [Dehalococcoidia bacterium]
MTSSHAAGPGGAASAGAPLGAPREIEVGGEPLTLRRATPADASGLHAFFLGLPAADLLVLRRDVTDGRHIDAWMEEIERGETVTVIAESEGTVLGEATLHLTGVPWSRHVGIVRVFTAREQRGRGLGRILIEEICALAPALGIEKLVAEMTVGQTAAKGLLGHLGFAEEARLRGAVKDRHGRPHDLIMMTRGLPEEPATAAGDGRPVAWRCTACGVVTHAPEPPNRCADCGAGPGFLLRADEE